jgi:hypothetical protein
MESEYEVDTRTILVKGNTRKIVFISEIEYVVKLIESFENKENRVREKEIPLEYGVNVLCIGCDRHINKEAEISFRLIPTYGCTFDGQRNHNVKMRRLQKDAVARREIILVHNRTTIPKSLELLALRALAKGRLDIKNVYKLKDNTGFVIPYKTVFPNLEYMLWQPAQGALFATLLKSTCQQLFTQTGHWKPLNTFNSAFLKIRKDKYPHILMNNVIRKMLDYLLKHPFAPYTELLWIRNPLLDDEIQSTHITKLPKQSADNTSSEEDDVSDEEVTQNEYSTANESDMEYPSITPDWDYYVDSSDEYPMAYPKLNSKQVENQILQEAQELRRQNTIKETEDDVEEEIEQLGKELLLRQEIEYSPSRSQQENEPGPSKPREAKERYPGPNPYKDPKFRHVTASPPPPEYISSEDSD